MPVYKFHLSEEAKIFMGEHTEINWSSVCRNAVLDRIETHFKDVDGSERIVDEAIAKDAAKRCDEASKDDDDDWNIEDVDMDLGDEPPKDVSKKRKKKKPTASLGQAADDSWVEDVLGV